MIEDSPQVLHLIQLIDEPKYPEAMTLTNAMPLGRKMRVFGKASADSAPRDPPSSSAQPASAQPEKPHTNDADAVKDKTSGLNSSDSAATQTTSSHGWGEPTAASTTEQGSGWDTWGSSSATNIPQVNAGW
ncbi:hypothetical protein QFC22_005155 [Naganishia vaughanmartiniae]|uniref:Uncharacterized protein n=1 Tax=Naganishia vaughanmartiniae TaxID=1424756 RepID=A0ACC2WVR7_9TREE|nr:hypothetical protein QFC22_005155 [Naganishia vaughanmartiniae]